MLEFKIVDVETAPYLYQERTCSMDPADISKNMGEVFGAVLEFAKTHGIDGRGDGLSVYREYDPNMMHFQAGFLVSPEAAQKAEGDTRAGLLPAGRALNFIHSGPYSKLRDSYGEMMAHVEEQGLKMGATSWEVYVVDGTKVTSEDDLRTDIYVMLE